MSAAATALLHERKDKRRKKLLLFGGKEDKTEGNVGRQGDRTYRIPGRKKRDRFWL